MAKTTKQKNAPQKTEETEVEEIPTESATDIEIDDILDEIDEVLEVNAEEFVRGYIQKGGE